MLAWAGSRERKGRASPRPPPTARGSRAKTPRRRPREARRARAPRPPPNAPLSPETAKLPGRFPSALNSEEPIAGLSDREVPDRLRRAPVPSLQERQRQHPERQKYLDENGVETRIIVGDDGEGEVAKYAEFFGKGTLMDPQVI